LVNWVDCGFRNTSLKLWRTGAGFDGGELSEHNKIGKLKAEILRELRGKTGERIFNRR